MVRGNPSDPDIAVVHIFKFEGDKVVELWDLGQLLEQGLAERKRRVLDGAREQPGPVACVDVTAADDQHRLSPIVRNASA